MPSDAHKKHKSQNENFGYRERAVFFECWLHKIFFNLDLESSTGSDSRGILIPHPIGANAGNYRVRNSKRIITRSDIQVGRCRVTNY